MAEVPTPRLPPDSKIIRTYDDDYAAAVSDVESEADSVVNEEPADEESLSIAERLADNLAFIKTQVDSANWVLEDQKWKTSDGTPVVLVKKPTASNLIHRVLNPWIYRNIHNIGSLHDLANLLRSDSDWEDQYNEIVCDPSIILYFNDFTSLEDNSSEAYIQAKFMALVTSLGILLKVACFPQTETKIIVGGILAQYQYDIRCSTDPNFINAYGRNLSCRSFAPGHMWYHGSRGVQILSCLHAFNCPKFLILHRRWKLFVENVERSTVLTFPFNNDSDHSPHVNCSLVHEVDSTFLKAIVICILSKRPSLIQGTSSKKPFSKTSALCMIQLIF